MKITYAFDDDEIDMLLHIPECPCMFHCMKETPDTICPNCHDGFLYMQQIQTYKDKGIYEVAMELQQIKQNDKRMESLQEEINSLQNVNTRIKQKYSDLFKPAKD